MTWQLISVNINRQTSDDIEVIKEKLLGFEHTRNGTPATVFSRDQIVGHSQFLSSKVVVCHGNKNDYASLLVSDKFSTIKRSWETEERCTAILFGTTMVMSVYAPDSKKSPEMYGECIASVVEVLREGRKGGARNFYIAGDINVEFGLMCTNENEEEELTKLYGPLCWKGYDKDPGG